MNTTSQQPLETVLKLARQLSTADQARLVARLTPTIASAFEPDEHKQVASVPQLRGQAKELAANTQSALARVLDIAAGRKAPSDGEIAQWRDERLSERYGV